MNRKTSIFITACWVAMAFSCVDSRAQDTDRVPDMNPQAAGAVDASAHADIEEGTKQQPLPLPTKRPATYSKWGFQSANQIPATQFRLPQETTSGFAAKNAKNLSTFGSPSSRATDATITPATDAKLTKPDRQSNPFGLSPGSQLERSRGRQRFETQVQPLSMQPEPSGVSTPLRGNEFGRINSPLFPNPFSKTYSSSQDAAKAKQHKALAPKSGGKTHSGVVKGSASDQNKKVGSELTTKPE